MAPAGDLQLIHPVYVDDLVDGMMRMMDVGGTQVSIVAGPASFDGEQIVGKLSPAPKLGAHTEEMLAEVGYCSSAIADMRARVVAS